MHVGYVCIDKRSLI